MSSATQILLERTKQRSGLTWGQVADAMGVAVRALHLWRNAGGISAAHEARLHDLAFVVDSVQLREPSDARTELISARSGRSLLERFHGGAAAQELALVAPWRVDARDGLARSVEALATGEPVDEDFTFLLYSDDATVTAFLAHAGTLLDDPTRSRRDWEAEIDKHLGATEQPPEGDHPATAMDTEASDDAGDPGPPPLFVLEDLGITLGVGAIASRPLVNDER